MFTQQKNPFKIEIIIDYEIVQLDEKIYNNIIYHEVKIIIAITSTSHQTIILLFIYSHKFF